MLLQCIMFYTATEHKYCVALRCVGVALALALRCVALHCKHVCRYCLWTKSGKRFMQ